MKILILNGNTNTVVSDFDDRLDKLSSMLTSTGHEVEVIMLKDKNINDCIGCYNCWLKTPGICVWKDDMAAILGPYVQADLVILATKVKMKFVGSSIKKITDRMLPLVHPYLVMNEDRMGHVMRYDNQPDRIMLLSSLENAEHIERIYGDKSKGMKNIMDLSMDLEELTHAITHY